MATIKAECFACDGTGLYQGMCEKDGEAVICLRCNGSGAEKIRYKPFHGRRGKKGITSIHRSRGSFIATGVGAVGESMTYAQFKANVKWEGDGHGK